MSSGLFPESRLCLARFRSCSRRIGARRVGGAPVRRTGSSRRNRPPAGRRRREPRSAGVLARRLVRARLLGFTHGQKDLAVTAVDAAVGDPAADADARRQTAMEQAQAFFPGTWDDIYSSAPREPNHGWLYRPDVPEAVVAADDALAVPW